MKQLSLKNIAVLFLSVTLLVVACKKGDTGPAGEDGAQGPQGPGGTPGAPGTPGPKGDSGTANVIYSDWLDVQYSLDTTNSFYGFRDTITASKLTADIINKGEVKVYFNIGTATAPEIMPLPVEIGNQIFIQPFFKIGMIILDASDDFNTIPGPPKRQQYRYIIIPGGVKTNGRVSSINWNDYNQVKAYLKLPD